jgi:hypothetical protein
MKRCSYCGVEYPDDAVMCATDHTPLDPAIVPPPPPRLPESKRPAYHFSSLSQADQQKAFVTLVTCSTLVAADMIVTRLRAAGIEAFLPDEYVMQNAGWNNVTFGYVRVQVPPKDYDAAKDLLAASGLAAG